MSLLIQHPAILIVAAGQSKRLGTPKQLLKFEGESLINRLIHTIITAVDFPITLVVGFHAEMIQQQLLTNNVNCVINHEWEEGMASSIRLGTEHIIQNDPLVDGIMVVVCDQPYINAGHIKALLEEQHKTGKSIVACYYADVLGTPALFHKSMFGALMSLKGDVGARKIIQDKSPEVAKLHFAQGALDIDTLADYEQLIKASSTK